MNKTTPGKINWGIIGPGKIAGKFASDLNFFADARLLGIASRELERAKLFSQKYNATKYYGSYEELAKDPKIDIVYIATPHTLHFENTMMCLRHGKSVLCEKPMGINSNEVKAMVKEARLRNLFLMEALWTRFIPATEKMLQLIEEDAIGNINFISADFGFKADTNPLDRTYNKKLGGGSLLDIGIYPIYLSILTLGVPKNIDAMARISETGVDSYCAILLDYQNGQKAVLNSTFEANTPTEAHIYGNKGRIKMQSPFHHSQKISIFKDEYLNEDFDINYIGNGYYHEIKEVTNCLKKGKIESNKLPHSLSLDLISVIDKVKQKIGLKYKGE